jgi:anti-sigma regulatory factor (Ser/Thr protein kinase)
MWTADRQWPSAAWTDPTTVAAMFNSALPAPPRGAATMSVFAFNLDAVRAFTAAHATRAGLGARMDDVIVVVNEVATNILTHGGGTGRLTAWSDGRQVVFQTDDTGHMDDPLAGRRPVPARATSGRGLMLTHRLADLVRHHSQPGRTTVRVHFAR